MCVDNIEKDVNSLLFAFVDGTLGEACSSWNASPSLSLNLWLPILTQFDAVNIYMLCFILVSSWMSELS